MSSLTYIYHDCFLYRTRTATGREIAILFDYMRDPDGRLWSLIPDNVFLYVLVSHFHKDHYSPDIFRQASRAGGAHYILSRDVARHARHILTPGTLYKGVRPAVGQVTILSKGDKYCDENVEIHAFGSTDIGNSYVVRVSGGDVLFHAGDLNLWSWRDESTAGEIAAAKRDYECELQPIAERFPEFDYAMFPVDSRIGTLYWEGAEIFLKRINVKRFFPMHFELADNDGQRMQRHRDALRFDLYAPQRGEMIGLTAPYSLYWCAT
ncbi:MAG: MBL fold metallo-hydrolase [Muribaculaceae bacterium]|nr:MBL fold metallo-hydrolase [Muribaculaceae bacterium]MDE6294437.1 MBL fold metallo-hydrolase [Muribaculaceae bacterium]